MAGLNKVLQYFQIGYSYATLRPSLIVTVVMYNWTEATFYGVNNMWILLMIGMIDPLRIKVKEDDGIV